MSSDEPVTHDDLDPPGGQVEDFIHAYRHGSLEPDDSADREDAAVIARGQYAFGLRRDPHEDLVRVYTATSAEHDWDAQGRVVIETVSGDRPFLVNSLTAYLDDRGLGVDTLLHPVLIVERDADGVLENARAFRAGQEGLGPGEVRESWTHLQLDAAYDEELADELIEQVRQILADVRVVTDDWAPMLRQVRDVLSSLDSLPSAVPEFDVSEAREFLSWLAGGHFTFTGYREYVIDESDGSQIMRALPESGLGILREGRLIAHAAQNEAAAEAARAGEHPLLLVTKADARSTVQRTVHLDRISIRTFDLSGRVVGERRFLGLFASAAYAESVRRIPILAGKTRAVMRELGVSPDSYNGRAVMMLLEGFPRDELFSADVDQVATIAAELVHGRDRRKLRCFVRRDQLGRFLSVLVYLPRDRYTTRARLAIDDVLSELADGGVTTEYTAWVTESNLARLHVVVRPRDVTTIDPVDQAVLQTRLAAAVRTWDDELTEYLAANEPDTGRRRSVQRAAAHLSEAYREDLGPATAVEDIRRMREVPRGGITVGYRDPRDDGRLAFTVYRPGGELSLAVLLPLFTSLGVDVVDERPYHFTDPDIGGWIYDFTLDYHAELDAGDRARFTEAFEACWRGDVEVDGYNRLVLAAGLDWRDVVLVRAYAKYLRQAGIAFSDDFVQTALLDNPIVTRLLVTLFATAFDPSTGESLDDRQERYGQVRDQLETSLDDVASRDADRVLRYLIDLIGGTIRTNYYQAGEDGSPKPWVSLKLEPKRIEVLPEPRPAFEIFCYSPRVEGVHLRFGLVARGGLRWSDRREDFRTEVLGLVKAQMVKNTVIVPTGSKGGFYAKQLPDPAADRDAWLAEGIEAYKVFISSLLDVTDNRSTDGATIPPADVVRWDGDDSYLVVAADKGTATFSDIANAVSADYGFWLGDAFASGGSVGYDHKQMGITARGAWESVKRHFREMGVDCQSEDFTCVGIGDMSGDVFGNGMLLSRHTRLVAAFDHRHVFIDPDPDARTSYAERQRLFELPRSSWADYDTSLISEGGGVFDRSAKRVTLTPQIREALGLPEGVTRLSPPELITAILQAPVDLLWNGGIGTYVKAQSETHAEVGDKANDAIRVDGGDLRCRCVGEGGNLGLTQLGRIEYALAGGRINTDFVDNSAGVDTSDHEVNIKILLNSLVTDGDLDREARDETLASMTDEVASLVLDHNIQQNLALSTAVAYAPDDLLGHHDLVRTYERAGLLDRPLEFLPSDAQISARRADGKGLVDPELCVLLAYTKIIVADALKETALAQDPFFGDLLIEYFPTPLRDRYRAAIEEHPLRADIIVTRVVNTVVDAAGLTYFHRVGAETGAPVDMLARAHVVAARILQTAGLARRIDEEFIEIDAQTRIWIRTQWQAQTERAARWLIDHTQNRTAPAVMEQLAGPVAEVLEAIPDAMSGRAAETFARELEQVRERGLPEDLARRVALVGPSAAAFGLAQLMCDLDVKAADVVTAYFALGQRLGLDLLAERIDDLAEDGQWLSMARSALSDEVQATHVELVEAVLSTGSGPAAERTQAWLDERTDRIDTAHDILRGMWAEGDFDVARLLVSWQMAKRLLH